MSRAEIVEWAQRVAEDLNFTEAREWIEHTGRRAVGVLPVYAPREVVWATGMLPVGIHGGGEGLEIIKGDAFYQSYICHLPRSVVELAMSGRLSMLSGVLFPSTCDVIRNLSGMWQVFSPETYVRYIDVPHVTDAAGGVFWRHELQTLYTELAQLAGVAPSSERLWEAIHTYNEVRRTVEALYEARRRAPWSVPSDQLYLLLRAGEVVPPERFLAQARAYLAEVERDPGRPRDNIRVIVVGSFCEQPPLGLIRTIERSGCYIVDDDFLLGNRLVMGPVVGEGDPLQALARAFLTQTRKSSILYEQDPQGKRRLVGDRVRAAGAQGVVFAAPSFCDPALLDRPMLKGGADAEGIPSIAFQYAENTGQFQQFREQAGTFADSIKLWGGA